MHRIFPIILAGLCACGLSEAVDETALSKRVQNRREAASLSASSCTLTSSSPPPTFFGLPSTNPLPLQCGVDTWQPPTVTAIDACGNPAVVMAFNTGADSSGPGPNTSVEGTYDVQYIAHDPAWITMASMILHVQVSRCCTPWTSPYGGGSGVANDPYQICSPQQFMAINQNLSSHFILTKDLNFTSVNFTPIGSTSSPFLGELDGKGKLLQQVTYSSPSDADHVGIFRATGPGALIHDLKLGSISMNGNNITGALVGQSNGSQFYHIVGSQLSVQTKGMGGGLVGYFFGDADIYNEDISDVSLDRVAVNSSGDGAIVHIVEGCIGAVTGCIGGKSVEVMKRIDVTNATIYWEPTSTDETNTYWTSVGGMVGHAWALQLLDSSFQGTVTGGYMPVGGVIGQFDNNRLDGLGYIDNVRVINTTVNGRFRTGGIAGVWNRSLRPGDLHTLTRVVFDGTVNDTQGMGAAGGVAGLSYFTAHKQLSIRANVHGRNYVGGLYGLASGAFIAGVEDVVFTGNVTSDGGDYVGLIAGLLYYPVPQILNRIYVSGSVNNSNPAPMNTSCDIGAIAIPESNINNIYYRQSIANDCAPRYAVPLSDVAMGDVSAFQSFDFANVWAMPSSNGWTGLRSPALRFQCGRDGVVCP